jgi:hypothetical protein
MSDPNLELQLEDILIRLEKLESESPQIRAKADDSCECDSSDLSPKASHKQEEVIHLNTSGESHTPGLEASGPLVSGAATIRATIDSTRSDNGFLGCVYARYRQSGNVTVLSHSSTLIARNNLSTGREGWSIIVGHGAPGLIITGTGQVVNGTQKYIATRNASTWRPILSRGVIGGGLTLFGCEVASGQAGAALLKLVANTIRKPVGAWTGLVWCSSTRVWGTGSFVTVRPGVAMDTSTVEEAPMMYGEAAEPLQVMRLSDNGEELAEVQPDAIRSVHFTPVGNYPTISDVKSMRAERGDALSILQRIDLENPFVTEDKPGSALVGMLNVTYGISGSEDLHTRTFKVLGSSLLQDATYPNTYYYTSNELLPLLR